MRQETINIFTFSELSDDAQEKAIQAERSEMWQYPTPFAQEGHDSIKEFCAEFGLDYKGSNFSTDADYDVKFGHIDDTILELQGARLVAYLWNKHEGVISERKPYGKMEKKANGKFDYARRSRCQLQPTCCPFTGVCYDEDLMDPIRKFLQKADPKTTLEDLMTDCLHSWKKSVRAECEAMLKDDYIKEELINREVEFTENGDKY